MEPLPDPEPAPVERKSSGRQGGFIDVTGAFHSFSAMDAREAELAKREERLAVYEQQIRDGTYQRPTEKNFPPYLHWWSWHPERDLSPDAIGLMRKIRILYFVMWLLYLENIAGAIALNFSSDFDETGATMIVLSVLMAFVLTPLAVRFAFFGMYKGMKAGKAIPFFWGFGLHCLWFGILVFNLIGFDWGAACGFIIMVDVAKYQAIGPITIIFCVAGTLIAIAHGFSIVWLIRFYRSHGLVDKAKREGAEAGVDYAKDHPDQVYAAATEASRV